MEKSQAVENLTLEQALTELETLTQQLEEGELTLAESLALFERGQHLVKHCNDLLDAAALRIRQILPGTDAEFDLQEFDPDRT